MKFFFGDGGIKHMVFLLAEINAADAVFASCAVEAERAIGAVHGIL